MARIIPSLVKDALEAISKRKSEPQWQLTSTNAAQVAAACELLARVPDELITLEPRHYVDFHVCLSALRYWRGAWERDPSFKVSGSTVDQLIMLLDQCADSMPAPGTTELPFVSDAALRDSIRLDISGAWTALQNGEFKASTVLGGAALEAVLLWAITETDQRSPGAIAAAAAALPRSAKLKQPVDRWGLEECVTVAQQLSLISAETQAQAKLAQDARNLVHPGRSQRLQASCDRVTALTAVTAVERVVADLAPKFT